MKVSQKVPGKSQLGASKIRQTNQSVRHEWQTEPIRSLTFFLYKFKVKNKTPLTLHSKVYLHKRQSGRIKEPEILGLEIIFWFWLNKKGSAKATGGITGSFSTWHEYYNTQDSLNTQNEEMRLNFLKSPTFFSLDQTKSISFNPHRLYQCSHFIMTTLWWHPPSPSPPPSQCCFVVFHLRLFPKEERNI